MTFSGSMGVVCDYEGQILSSVCNQAFAWSTKVQHIFSDIWKWDSLKHTYKIHSMYHLWDLTDKFGKSALPKSWHMRGDIVSCFQAHFHLKTPLQAFPTQCELMGKVSASYCNSRVATNIFKNIYKYIWKYLQIYLKIFANLNTCCKYILQ